MGPRYEKTTWRWRHRACRERKVTRGIEEQSWTKRNGFGGGSSVKKKVACVKRKKQNVKRQMLSRCSEKRQQLRDTVNGWTQQGRYSRNECFGFCSQPSGQLTSLGVIAYPSQALYWLTLGERESQRSRRQRSDNWWYAYLARSLQPQAGHTSKHRRTHARLQWYMPGQPWSTHPHNHTYRQTDTRVKPILRSLLWNTNTAALASWPLIGQTGCPSN